METWAIIWGVVLAVVLISYTGLFVWVTAGGWADIRSMLRTLERQHEESARAEERNANLSDEKGGKQTNG